MEKASQRTKSQKDALLRAAGAPQTKSRKTASNKSKGRRRSKKRKVTLSPWIVFIPVALIIALYIIKPILTDNVSYDYGAEVPEKLYGEFYIDISHHNGNLKDVDWNALKVLTDGKGRTITDFDSSKDVYPLSGVIIKATEGANLKDKNFKSNWKAVAEAENLKRGAYHFFNSRRDGKTQARNFISAVGEMRFKDLAPILDIETIHDGCSKEILNKRVMEWLTAVEKHYDKKPIIYTGDSFAKDYLSREILENYPIWIAHYKIDRPKFENWAMWQFAEDALVYGFPGKVDLSISRMK